MLPSPIEMVIMCNGRSAHIYPIGLYVEPEAGELRCGFAASDQPLAKNGDKETVTGRSQQSGGGGSRSE